MKVQPVIDNSKQESVVLSFKTFNDILYIKYTQLILSLFPAAENPERL